jgi:hypothetical protein
MKEKMWDDMFTPEGVLMTSPFQAGMSGPMNWKHEAKCAQRPQQDDDDKAAA